DRGARPPRNHRDSGRKRSRDAGTPAGRCAFPLTGNQRNPASLGNPYLRGTGGVADGGTFGTPRTRRNPLAYPGSRGALEVHGDRASGKPFRRRNGVGRWGGGPGAAVISFGTAAGPALRALEGASA